MTYPPVTLPENVPSPITLTTDFGLSDAYVASMKGVILDILPWAKIVDISHDIEPQNVVQAAHVLGAAAPYFPRKTVHVVVVDPGVGTDRRPLAVITDRACYIGPDNGVFSLVYTHEHVQEIRLLSNLAYQRPPVSHTFHGRDVFAPVAAYIASGAPYHSVGPLVTDPIQIDFPQPTQLPDNTIRGQILYADHFGNLISNIPAAWLDAHPNWVFEIGGVTLMGLHATYGDAEPDALVVLANSAGFVEVAMRNGSAAAKLSVGAGTSLQARPA